MPRFHFALDLRNDSALIEEYERWHRPEQIWPTVARGLRDAGVNELELFRCGNRLLQVLDVAPAGSLAKSLEAAAANPDLQAWETLMWRFQLALPFANAGEKWVPMTRLFSLRDTLSLQNPHAAAGAPAHGSKSTPNG